MNYDLNENCAECPYLPLTSGWIGSHDSAKEFHDIVCADKRFPCHMTNDDLDSNPSHCVGYALYMNKMCKVSRDPVMANFQNRIRMIEDSLPKPIFSRDGKALIKFHKR